VKYDRHFKFK